MKEYIIKSIDGRGKVASIARVEGSEAGRAMAEQMMRERKAKHPKQNWVAAVTSNENWMENNYGFTPFYVLEYALTNKNRIEVTVVKN